MTPDLANALIPGAGSYQKAGQVTAAGINSCTYRPQSSYLLIVFSAKDSTLYRGTGFTAEDAAQSNLATVNSGGPDVTNPSGLGSYAIMYFHTGNGHHVISWVQGTIVYDLDTWTGPSVSKSQFLSIAQQISAHIS